MKTKYFLLTTVLLFSFKLYSQQGEILYTQFVQDTCQFFKDVPGEGFGLDMDGDSICDFVSIGDVYNAVSPMPSGFRTLSPEWKLTRCFNYHPIPDTAAGPGWMQEVLEYYDNARLDTLSHWRDMHRFAPYVFHQPIVDTTFRHLIYGFRREVSGDDEERHYCYGWLECSIRWNYYSPGNGAQHPQFTQVWICINRMAYCNIPDYPLHAGQTSLTNIEENEAHRIAKLHPNPTTGIVHIEDVECAEVQVYNTLGQMLKTSQNTNQVSLGGLPQGVYLLRVTTKDGKVFSDKVVKE